MTNEELRRIAGDSYTDIVAAGADPRAHARLVDRLGADEAEHWMWVAGQCPTS
jgi:hypothetical protein